MSGRSATGPDPEATAARLALAAALLLGLALLPAGVARLVERAEVLRLWGDPDRQRALSIGEGHAETLTAADRLLALDAPVLLVTAGEAVRGREYRLYNRALDLLAPRSVWWMNPAPPDGTWESRWWISSPIDPETVRGRAGELGARCVLLDVGATVELAGRRAPVGDSGSMLVELPTDGPSCWADRDRASVGGSRSGVGDSGLARGWPLGAAAALAVVLALGAPAAARGRSGLTTTSRSGRTALLAVSWLVGAGVLGAGMLILAGLGIGTRGQQVALSIAALVALFSVLRGRRFRAPAGSLERRRDRWGWAWVALIAVQASIVLTLSVGQPIGGASGWDGWASWGVKSRILHREGGLLTDSLLADPSRAVTLPGYPLQLPLVQAWLYGWIGAPDDRLVGIVVFAFYLALVALTAQLGGAVGPPAGGRSRGEPYGWCGTAVVATAPFVAGATVLGLADVPVAALALLAAGALIGWLREGRMPGLALSTVAAALLPWTKREGIALVAALVVAALIVDRGSRRARLAAVVLSAAAAAVAVAWWWGPARGTTPFRDFSPPEAAGLGAALSRLPTVARLELPVLGDPGFLLVWPLAALVGLVCWRRRSSRGARPDDLLLLGAVIYLGIVTLGYLVSDYQPYQQHVLTSFFRLATQVMPLAVVWLARGAARSAEADRDRAAPGLPDG